MNQKKHKDYNLSLKLKRSARKIAAEISANAPLAVSAVKEAAIRGLETNFRDGVVIEAMIAERVMRSDDIQEGFKAFMEKRKPEWKGK